MREVLLWDINTGERGTKRLRCSELEGEVVCHKQEKRFDRIYFFLVTNVSLVWQYNAVC